MANEEEKSLMAKEEYEEEKCSVLKQIVDAVQSPEYRNGLSFTNFLLSNYPMAAYCLALKASILDHTGECKKLICICTQSSHLICTGKASNIKKLQKLRRDAECIFDSEVGTEKFLMNIHQVDATNTQEMYIKGDLNKLSNLISRYRYQVRVESLEQDKTVEEMYKLVDRELFLLWAICMLQLQVAGHKGSTLLTKLEELRKRHIDSHKLMEPKCVLLHIHALEQQAKYNEAIEIFSKQEGEDKVTEVEKLHIEGRLLALSCDYDKAAEVFGKVLQECRTGDWKYFQKYISCLLKDDSMWLGGNSHHPPKLADRKPSPLSDEAFDSCILSATQFVKDLIPEADKNGLRLPPGTHDIPRWHHLACLEIESRKILQGRGDVQKLMMALVNYFKRLGHLAWFASAALLFLQVLTRTKRGEFVGILMEMCESKPVMSFKRICKITTVFKLLESLGIMFGFCVEELEKNAVTMTQLYAEWLPLSKGLDLQENRHCEELICMTCNVLVQLFWRTQDLGYLLEAVWLLEHGLIIKRKKSQFKILLVHLYSHIGAISLAYERYKTLGYNYILLETMSHHMLPQLLVSPFWLYSKDLIDQYLSFIEYYFEENVHLVYLGLCNRNFLEVIESVEQKKRLKCSHKYLMTNLEGHILKLKQNADIVEIVENVLQESNCGTKWLELSNVDIFNSSFTEDFQTRPWWTPTPDINYLLEPWVEGSTPGLGYKNSKKNPNQEREDNLQIAMVRRSLTPRLICLSMEGASSVMKTLLEDGSHSTGNREFFTLLVTFAGSFSLTFNAAVNQIVGMSSGQDFSQVLHSDTVDWMNFAVFWNAWRLSTKEGCSQDDWLSSSWKTVNGVIQKLVDKMRSMNISSSYVSLSTLIQMVTEPMAWHIVVLKSCVRSLLSSNKKKKKLTQKEIEQATEQLEPFHKQVQVIYRSIQSMLGWMLSWTKSLREESKRLKEEKWAYTSISCCSKLGSDSEVNREKMIQGIKESQQKTVNEFLTICNSKTKVLLELKYLLVDFLDFDDK